MKSIREYPKKNIFIGICIALLVVVLSIFVYTGRSFGTQAMNAMYLSARFEGQYKVADGEWQTYVKGKHIPATRGDVLLKGNFQLVVPSDGEVVGTASEGVILAFYFNHIGCEISENGVDFRPFDAEIDAVDEDMCGEMYIGYMCEGSEEITLRFTNPHKFGNPYAVDEFLNNLSTYGGTSFERDVLNMGGFHRILGTALILFSFMVLGTALFAMLIHIRSNANLWLIGLSIFFAGIYFVFKAHGVMFFSEIIKFNTRMLTGSMMLYMLGLTAFIAFQLKGNSKKIGIGVTALIFLSVATFMIAPSVSAVRFFDTMLGWAILQSAVCVVMTVLLVIRFVNGTRNEKTLCILGLFPMLAFVTDTVCTGLGIWQGGAASEIVFILLFVAALILVLNIFPKNLNAARRARELEAEKVILKAELTESRIATLISQIQPHFIYNTLGTIEQLCLTEPEAASKLVRNFSLYLRGNFSELDNVKPIRFSQEMNHVKHYTDIEQVRFPDMTIQYDLRSVEFLLPALSVQPLVENAIKHGLMGLEEGGIVTISAYETDSHYVVEVTDDGVGFDMTVGYDTSKHVGIKNIRARIEAMCGGTLTIESKPGCGTKATLNIPKEATENDSDNG
ncbi:MAG: histidine kinase [Clostridia bacterium]|nr:histidine kinase [Clostridia bacterium]